MARDIEQAILESPEKFDEQDSVDPNDLSAQYIADMDATKPQWAKDMLSSPHCR